MMSRDSGTHPSSAETGATALEQAISGLPYIAALNDLRAVPLATKLALPRSILPAPRRAHFPASGWFRVSMGTIVAAAAAWMGPPGAEVALVALCAILCAILFGPRLFGIPGHVWGPPLGVGGLLLATQVAARTTGGPAISWSGVSSELAVRFGVPILILCFAYLSISLDESGFFRWCSMKLLRVGGGSGKRLLLCLFVGVSALTFFTSNDIVILTVTPILIDLGNRARIRNMVPFLLALFVAANTASMGLYIGNPTNVVVGSAVGIGFVAYAERMIVPTLIATTLALVTVWLLFTFLSRKDRIPVKYVVPATGSSGGWNREMTLKVTIFGACLVLLALFGNPWLVGHFLSRTHPNAMREGVSRLMVVVTVVCALTAFAFDAVRDRLRHPEGATAGVCARLRRMPFEIVPFFLSFCLLLRCFEEAGLTRHAVEGVLRAFEHGPVVGSLWTGLYAICVVNLMNNIPAAILFEKAWLGSADTSPPIIGLSQRLPEIDPSFADIFVEVALFASNFGANLTFIGALAGLMWLRAIRDQATCAREIQQLPTGRDFVVYGAFIVPVVTAGTCLAIGWLRSP
jgi:arsenical pump membrane protein